jgi:hypothetical protein
MMTRFSAIAHARRRDLLMSLLGALTGIEFLENAMFVFAVTPIMQGVGAPPQAVVQVQAAYAIACMLVLVKQHWLADQFGYRRYLCGALALFVAGALACAFSTSLDGLTAARFVQGLGGGALFTSSRVLVNMSFPAAERAPAVRRFIICVFGAAALGPVLSSFLLAHGSWSWIFLGIVPPALMALVASAWLLPDAHPGRAPMPWAWRGLLLFGIAAVGLQMGLSEASYGLFEHPWLVTATCVLALALMGAFAVHQWHHPAPLLHLRQLNSPVYLTGLALYFLYYLLTNFGNALFPVYAEHGMGLGLRTTGWLNSLGGAAGLCMALAYLRWSALLQTRRPLMLAGLTAMFIAALWFAFLPAGAPPFALWPGIIAKGWFGVLMVLPVAGLSFRELGEDRFAQAYQAKNLMRQIAISMSTAVATVLVHTRAESIQAGLGGPPGHVGADATLAAAQQSYLVLAALVLLTMAVVWRQRRLP